MDKLSDKAFRLILDSEGLNQPSKWPGGNSGITIGIGYDLGQMKAEQFDSDWGDVLSATQLQLLRTAIGLKGVNAKNRAPAFSGITIKRADAEKVFAERTIPIFQAQTEQAFPGVDQLPADAQGALVSLVYNRGPAMTDNSPDDRRREMRAIRDAVAKKDLQEIANQLRAMKRLWVGKNLPGLLKRRDAEAALVESSIASAQGAT